MIRNCILILITFILCIGELNSNYSQENPQLDISYTTEFYDYMRVLVEPDKFTLFWSRNQTHVLFEIHAKLDVWIGFGLSPNGSLPGSDVVVAWLDDKSTGYFSNGHIDSKLVLDNRFNWKLVHSMRNQEITIFKLSRRIKFCHENDSIVDFSQEGNYFIFTWGYLGEDINFNNSNTGFFFEKFIIQKYECQSNRIDNHSDFDSKPLEKFDNFVELEKNTYHLYWNISDDFLIAEIHVKTTGWIGFGLSPDGKMRDSDVFIGWIKDGKVYFSDRYVYGKRAINDINIDIELLNAFESKGYTVFKIRRPLVLCDPDDRSIETGTPYVIFPWHINHPESPHEIILDNNNYSAQLNFFSKNPKTYPNETEDQVFALNLQNKIIPINYYQYCEAFKIPKNLTKKHIYKWSVLLPTSEPNLISSIKLYECTRDYLFASEVNCDLSLSTAFCSRSSIGWNPGSELVVSFPDDVGYPIGAEADYDFLVLNLEFKDLEQSSKFIDNLSIKLYLTDKLRKHELGSVTLGTESGPLGILVPPGLTRFPVNTYCFNSCFEKKFDYVTFAMASPQTHSAGIQVSTRIVRNKTDIGFLHKNEFFNFNYQYYYELNPRVVISKNDSLITQCVYSTKNYTKIIQGGSGPDKEVCLYSYFYYPRINNFKTCKSIPTFDDQLRVFKRLRNESVLNFTSSINDSDVALLYEAYNSLEQVEEFTDNLIQNFFSIYLSSRFYAICDGSLSYETHDRLMVNSFGLENDQCHLKINKKKNFLDSKSAQTKSNLKHLITFSIFNIIIIAKAINH